MSPAFPAAFLLVMSLPFLVPVAGRRLAEAGRVSAPAWPATRKARRWVVGIVAFLGLAPLVPILAFGQQRGEETGTAIGFWTLEPLNTFPVRAAVHGRTVTLAWPDRSNGTRVVYGIFRYPAGSEMVACPPQGTAAIECQYSPWSTSRTRENHFTDKPGRGRWRYRVAVVAGVPPPASDVIELSSKTPVVWVRTGPGPKPPPPPPPNKRAYCVQGNFELLPLGKNDGAPPALYVLGTGLTCSAPPGYVRKGYATADEQVVPGFYPLYVPAGP